MAKEKSMRDLMNKEIVQADPVDRIVQAEGFDNLPVEVVEEYNAKLVDLDPIYSELKPTSSVLVRLYIKKLETTSSGIVIPEYSVLYSRTQNGVPSGIKIEDPFPFMLKAVVVAKPVLSYDLPYNVGDTVILHKSAITKTVEGRGDDAIPQIENSFVHPDYGSSYDTPTDVTDPNYGYLEVGLQDIRFVI